MEHHSAVLLQQFNPYCARVLEGAASLCQTRAHAEITPDLARRYGLTTHIGESLIDTLTTACLLPDTGARNVDSLLNQQILPVLSQRLLSHMAAKQKASSLQLTWDDGQAEGEAL